MAARAAEYFGNEPWFPTAIEAFLAVDPPRLSEQEMNDLLQRSAPLMYSEWTASARHHAYRPDSAYAPAARDGFWASGFDVPGFDVPGFDVPGFDVPAGLAKVDGPVTIIAGEWDIFTDPDLPAVMAGWFPNATVTWLTGCGHMPWIDRPDETAAAVEQALSR
jgi:pimeloyl-ACP methyl ester carboxylesterase